MPKIIFILILFISSISTNVIWGFGQKSPLKVSSLKLSSHQISPNGQVFSSLYTATNKVEEGAFQKQYLQIDTAAKKWWLSNTSDPTTISKINFIDNRYLLIIQSSTTVTVSNLIDKRRTLGGGTAEYIGKTSLIIR